jgi:hypothetical protein
MMKKVNFIFLLFIISFSTHPTSLKVSTEDKIITRTTDWAVIGGGPAGITVVGLLLDLGITDKQITWIDDEFVVGGLHYYQNVPANAKTKMFIEFLQACTSFSYCHSPAIDRLFELDLEKEYDLKFIVEPLQDITNYLRQRVVSIKSRLIGLNFHPAYDAWILTLSNSRRQIRATNVVLATGSHPRVLNYEECKNQIPLDEALDKQKLAAHVNDTDTIVIVGSAHSAILILKYLSELPVPRIFNFYTKPIVYPIQMDGWVLNDNTGLMGVTAQWAKEVLEKNPPAKIIRLYNKPEIREAWLPLCTKIIYAAGFERNELPSIPGVSYDDYNAQTGIIGPRLFGIGIAFPEVYTDPLGNVEHAVGLPDFMEYAQKIVPTWVQREPVMKSLSRFNELFLIHML